MIYDVINIGFGISGITATKNALENFENVLTLEREPKYGGCWFNKSYPNVRLQTHKDAYMYSNSYLDSSSNYPNRDEIMNYLQNYINKYKLDRCVKYNIDVKNIYRDDGNWCIEFFDKDANSKGKLFTKYLIMCTGLYNNHKQPYIKNLDKYGNEYINSDIFSYKYNNNYDIFKGKNVFIIGNGPTGCDLACNAVNNGAKNVSLIYRSTKWIFKRKYQSLIFANRLLFKLLQKIPEQVSILTVYILFFIAYYLKGYYADIELPNSIPNRNNIAFNEQFYNLYNQGKIKYIQSQNLETTHNSIIINGIQRKKCDIIVNACGYDINIPLGKNNTMNSIPLLYKRIIHPSYNTLGFIGFSPSYNWLPMSEIQSIWLMHYFKNEDKPKKEDKIRRIKKDFSIAKSSNYEYVDLAICMYDYLDDLLSECGRLKNNTFYNRWLSHPNNKYWLN